MALREVNLIPAGILYRRVLLRHLCFWGGCTVVCVALIFGFFVYQSHVILSQHPALRTLDDIQTLMGKRLEEIKRIQTDLGRLNQQQAVLETITRNQSYCRVLWKLADTMNEDTWLTQLSIDRGAKKKGTVRLGLKGLSFSNATLGSLMNELSIEPMFNAVQLNFAKERNIRLSGKISGKTVKLIQFEIESQVSDK